MLLVIDVGNTNTVLGVYEGEVLVGHWRIGTERERTADEWGILFRDLFLFDKIDIQDFEGMIISSVVPPVLDMLQGMAEKYFHVEPLVVGPDIETGMPILYDNPAEVGADRIVNAVAAFERYKKCMIVVDFGTATTFDYVSSKGEYIGGAIAPGIGISAEALFERTSKLPRVEIVKPKRIIGKTLLKLVATISPVAPIFNCFPVSVSTISTITSSETCIPFFSGHSYPRQPTSTVP